MPTTDTKLQQLVINVGTKAQIESAIAGGTITQDMLSVATDGDTYIQGVKVNGTELTPDANNKVDVLTSDILPSQTSQSGKYLTTNGVSASWGTINALQNTASGQGSLTILGTPATGENAVNIGNSTSATKWATISIGYNNSSTGDYAISIGESVIASGNQSIAIGRSAKAQNDYAIAIGFSARISNLEAIAIGHSAWARGYCSTAGGTGAETGVSSTQATAIGYKAKANANYAIQIGYGTNTEASTFYVGFNNTNYKLLDGNGLIPPERHAAVSSTAGEYVAKITVDSQGNATASWGEIAEYTAQEVETLWGSL
jgi:hypothetical protein